LVSLISLALPFKLGVFAISPEVSP